MATVKKPTPVYLEIGSKRTFACAVEWPGWTAERRGRGGGADRPGRLRAALCPRAAGRPPHLRRAERRGSVRRGRAAGGQHHHRFWCPGGDPGQRHRPGQRGRAGALTQLLHACWAAFDKTVAATGGKELRKGPRGGGDLSGVIAHVLGADGGYLTALGGQAKSARPG